MAELQIHFPNTCHNIFWSHLSKLAEVNKKIKNLTIQNETIFVPGVQLNGNIYIHIVDEILLVINANQLCRTNQ